MKWSMSSSDVPAGSATSMSAGMVAAAQDTVRDRVAAVASERSEHRWVVLPAAATAGAAAACVPVGWPPLVGGAAVGSAAFAYTVLAARERSYA